MNNDEEIKMLKRKLYELENKEYESPKHLRETLKRNAESGIPKNPVERWNAYPPKAIADEMGIMHPQVITNTDWGWIWFDALALWGACIALLIYLTLIDF
tara:strand:- start:447 stop:746 length:300 start_codon:yes stop_codon:yes gene_type:complete